MVAEKAAEREREAAEKSDGEEAQSEASDATWVAEAGVSDQEFQQELEEDEKVARAGLGTAGERESLEGQASLDGMDAEKSALDGAKESVDVGTAGVRASVSGASQEGLSPLLDELFSEGSASEGVSGQEIPSEIAGVSETAEARIADMADDIKDTASKDADAGLDAETADSDVGTADSDAETADSEPMVTGPDGVKRPLKLVRDLVVLEDEVPQARIDQMLDAVAAYRRRDVETLTPEERAALRKKGLGERRFLQVGEGSLADVSGHGRSCVVEEMVGSRLCLRVMDVGKDLCLVRAAIFHSCYILGYESPLLSSHLFRLSSPVLLLVFVSL